MKTELPQISPQERNLVLRILQRCAPEHRAAVFGSRARVTARRYSDLDLLLTGVRPLNPREQGDLHEALDESDLPYRVDLIDAQSADLRFVELIRPELRDLN